MGGNVNLLYSLELDTTPHKIKRTEADRAGQLRLSVSHDRFSHAWNSSRVSSPRSQASFFSLALALHS